MAGDHDPKIAGMEYLSIFAQPNRHSGVDVTPLGALPHPAPEQAVGYAMVGAQAHFAWLREGNRIFAVTPGDDVPRLGHVAAIAPREGRWALLSTSGDVLLIGGASDIAGSGGARFDKRMIFNPAR